MPIEAAAGLGAAASASNALITIFKQALHFKEIPAEVEQLRHAIRNLESGIQICKRLRRQKSQFLDQVLKTEVDDSVRRSEDVLESICRTIEGCRADLDTKGTVSVRKRLDWMFRGHEQFMSQGMTLNSSVALLGMHISRMDNVRTVDTPLIAKDSSLSPESAIRAPSVRTGRKLMTRLSSRSSFSNMSVFSFSSEPTAQWSTDDLQKWNTYPTDGKEIKPAIFPTKRDSFSDEKEAVVARVASVDRASVHSFDSSLSASMTLIPDLGCTGDYCTNDLCPNHDNRPVSHQSEKEVVEYRAYHPQRPVSRSSVSSFRYSISEADSSSVSATGSTATLPGVGILQSVSKRRLKSGFV